MRPNEEFVLNALVSKFGGSYTEGDDPPDGYLTLEERKIAVEVTALVQQVDSGDGLMSSRLKDDAPVAKMANELNDELDESIPTGKSAFLILPAPLNKIRRTKSELSKIIISMITGESTNKDIEIFGNRISINIYNRKSNKHKKVAAGIVNHLSSANIGQNASFVLEERIRVKNSKIATDKQIDEYWLALYNYYWLADMETYRNAYSALEIGHGFSKIFIVDGYSQVSQLC